MPEVYEVVTRRLVSFGGCSLTPFVEAEGVARLATISYIKFVGSVEKAVKPTSFRRLISVQGVFRVW